MSNTSIIISKWMPPDVIRDIGSGQQTGFIFPINYIGNYRVGQVIRIYGDIRGEYYLIEITHIYTANDLIDAFYRCAPLGVLCGYGRNEFVEYYNNLYHYPWEPKPLPAITSKYILDMGGLCVIKFAVLEKKSFTVKL